MKHIFWIMLVVLSPSGLVGCHRPPPPPPTGGINPPTEAFETVVAGINRNNEKIPTLWARQSFEATIVDRQKNKRSEVVGDGALLYKRPRGFLLRGTRPGMELFTMGSADGRYWLTLNPDADTMWWGKYENLGKPCTQEALEKLMPIRPDLVLEVLGVGTIDSNFTVPPVPTMRYNPDRDVYMFVWNMPLVNRWWAQREVWYDRRTLLPTLVVLFDINGRAVLRAVLDKHQPVPVPDLKEPEWPRVATSYRLYFPETRTKMSITLSDLTLDKNGIPARRGLRFPDLDKAGVAHVVQIDEGCE
jgi:hypothetical protein